MEAWSSGGCHLLHIFHVIIRLLTPSTVVVHLLYTASEITSIYTEILVQYHSKATYTVCSIKLKREEFLYIRTIFSFQAERVLIYMLLFYQISAWVFLIHIFLFASFYCSPSLLDSTDRELTWILHQLVEGNLLGEERPLNTPAVSLLYLEFSGRFYSSRSTSSCLTLHLTC